MVIKQLSSELFVFNKTCFKSKVQPDSVTTNKWPLKWNSQQRRVFSPAAQSSKVKARRRYAVWRKILTLNYCKHCRSCTCRHSWVNVVKNMRDHVIVSAAIGSRATACMHQDILFVGQFNSLYSCFYSNQQKLKKLNEISPVRIGRFDRILIELDVVVVVVVVVVDVLVYATGSKIVHYTSACTCWPL
jgi:hypothetical protein